MSKLNELNDELKQVLSDIARYDLLIKLASADEATLREEIALEELQTVPVEVGQIYACTDPESHYVGRDFFVVQVSVRPPTYCLIDLTDGVSWENPCENVEDVFAGFQGDFELQ